MRRDERAVIGDARSVAEREPARATTSTDGSHGQLRLWGVVWLVAAVVATAAASVIALAPEGATTGSPAGGIDPDGWGLPLLQVATYLAGIVTFGFLLAAVFIDPQGRKGYLSRTGRRDMKVAAVSAAIWSVLALSGAVVSMAGFLGIPVVEALRPATLSAFFWSVPQSTALAITAIVAALIAITALVTSSLGLGAVLAGLAAVGLSAPSLAVHPTSLGDHSLSMSAGVLHVVAASAWLGALMVLCLHAWRRGADVAPLLESYRRVALMCAVVVAVSGLGNAYVRLSHLSQLVTTDYGRLVLVKAVLLAAVLLIGWNSRVAQLLSRPGGRTAAVRLAALEVAVLVAAVGVAVGMGQAAQPRAEAGPTSVAEQLLGFSMPPAPTWSRLVLGWHPEMFMLLIGLVAAALYVVGVVRMRRRGNRWPPGRTAAWLAGCAVLIWSTNAGIAEYASAVFSWHMLQHMVLSMLVPILLVLGAPITLSLRAISPSQGDRRGGREWIVWALDTPVIRFLTQPLVALLLYTVSVYVLYLTPLFSSLMNNHIGHLGMQVHFLLTGYIFYWVVIGVDYAPHRPPHWARLLLLMAALPLHAFFAIAVMLGQPSMEGDWFIRVQPLWLPDLLQDQYVGGGIAWGFGEVPTLLVLLALAVQWSRGDDREARRNDRQADRDGDAELVAYNAHLQRLADRDAANRDAADRDAANRDAADRDAAEATPRSP